MARPRHAVSMAVVLSGAVVLLSLSACELPRPAGPGKPSATASDAPAAGELTDGPAPLPPGAAEAIDASMGAALPDVRSAGLSEGGAVWFVADRDGKVRKAWVGPAYSETEYRRVALSSEFDALKLVVWRVVRTARNGASVPVVWAMDGAPWEGGTYLGDRLVTMLRDTIRSSQPSLLRGLRAGQAIYYEQESNNLSARRMWVGPVLTDSRERWNYVRRQYADRVYLTTTPTSMVLEDGRRVPLVHLTATPWGKRYGE